MGLRGTERQAQRAFERQVLAQIVALADTDGIVPIERAEQAIGYYRHTVAGNPAQQVLGRRLGAAIDGLYAAGLLDSAAPLGTYRPSPEGRALVAERRRPWWRRLMLVTRPG